MSHSIDERYDAYTETFPTARKEHVCEACDEQIAKGSRYARITTVFDGTANTYKRCVRCQEIHVHLRERGDGSNMWPDERLSCGEEYAEHWGEPPPDEIVALAFWRPGDAVGKP